MRICHRGPERPRVASRSIDFRHESLQGLARTLVAGIGLARRQWKFDRRHVPVWHLLQQMADAVEACTLLVVGIDDVPRAFLGVGMGKHAILRLRELDPRFARLEVPWAEFPALEGVAHSLVESQLLLRL